MWTRYNLASLVFMGITLQACMSHRVVDVREHMFSSQPLWESSEIRSVPAGAVQPKASISDVATSIAGMAKDRPGLSMIVRQVFAEDLAARQRDRGQPVSSEPAEVAALMERGSAHLKGDPAPLAHDIATLPVMKVIAGTMWQQELLARGVMATDATLPVSMPRQLSLADFKAFGDAIAVNLVRPYQSIPGAKVTGSASKLESCKPKLTFTCLFTAYMMAYFNGNFVDRNGGSYTKPKLGLTISNETISAAVAIFLEALFDYSIIDGTSGSAPIVYNEDTSTTPSKPKWLTKENKAPTLAEVAIGIGAVDSSNGNLPVLENVIENGKSGKMDAGRLCVVRMLGGAAGDAAQPVTGMVVRAFGGANLGFSFGLGALGKVSFGDNDTLTKLIDAVVENVPRRSTEIAIENALYGEVAPKPGVLSAALEIASWLTGCR